MQHDPEHLLELSNGKKKLPLTDKRDILTRCIYGVDIDVHAVEVSKFSLLIKLIEDETLASVKECVPILPDLSSNIKNGNSLICREDISGKDMSIEALCNIKPFEWSMINSGSKFDAIIGNPPYVKTEDIHAHSVFFKYDDWKKNVDQGKAAYLIDFPDTPIEKYSQGQKNYIELGEKNGDNTGYKCKIREKWYQIPSVWVPDAFFLRRNNLYPKFVLNCCDAVSTDTMHRIKFNNGIEPERIVLSYYNSISFAFTEICGRSYGGGVLEILPGEVGNVLVPILDCVPIEKVKEILYQVDEIVRNGENIEKALDLVDNSILGEYLHVNEETCSMARGIWKKMQHRRLKRG